MSPTTIPELSSTRPMPINRRGERVSLLLFDLATGQLAKTDALDARALAHVAEAVRPTPRLRPPSVR